MPPTPGRTEPKPNPRQGPPPGPAPEPAPPQTPAQAPPPPPGRDPLNEEYLEAVVRWLVLRLRRASHHHEHEGREQEGGAVLWVPEDEVALGEAERAYADAEGRMPALVELGRRLKLSQFEYQVLLLCVAAEISPVIPALCGRVRHSPGDYPCFAVAREAFPETFDWDALSPDRPLRRARLIEIYQPAGRPLLTSPLRAEERVVQYARGHRDLDDRLGAWFDRFRPPGWAGALPPSQARLVAEVIDALGRSPRGEALPVVQLVGADRLSKKLIAFEAAGREGRMLYQAASEALPGSVAEIDSVARIWERETRLMPLALYLDAEDLDPPGAAAGGPEPAALPGGGAAAAAAQSVLRLLARTRRMVFLGVRDRWPLGAAGRETITADVGLPEPEEQEDAWADALGGSEPAGQIATVLSGQFDLNAATIRRIAAAVPQPALAPPDDPQYSPMDAERAANRRWGHDLWDACRREVRPRLEALAAHLDPRADWERLVLPTLPVQQLREIADQVRLRPIVHRRWGLSDRVSRGLGLSVLFAGESGTGKTLAAEVLARELRLDLFVVDLSAVVSKYIGETEKNLRRLFDAAEGGGCALLFNEADALFGKRSAVKDSHDRYANIEIDYLLQRIEAFRGLAILTTNRKSDLDQAFLRRLRFLVDFPFPEKPERVKIWRTLLPPPPEGCDIGELVQSAAAPTSARRPDLPKVIPTKDLHYDRLGDYRLNGGAAFNVSINAAFRAAAAGSAVGMEHVLPAIRAELQKERPVSDSEFVWPPPAPRVAARRPATARAAEGAAP